MKRVVLSSLCLLLLISCGSYQKTENQQNDQTSVVTSSITVKTLAESNVLSELSETIAKTTNEHTDDSTETVIVKETVWYDTSRADGNGSSPVLRKETITSTTRHGKHTSNDSAERTEDTGKCLSTTNVHNFATKEESAESASRSRTEKDTSAAETKQLAYTSRVLCGLAFFILAAILAYWVFTKYRQCRIR